MAGHLNLFQGTWSQLTPLNSVQGLTFSSQKRKRCTEAKSLSHPPTVVIKGSDFVKYVEVTLNNFHLQVKCRMCDGKGSLFGDDSRCNHCMGNGIER